LEHNNEELRNTNGCYLVTRFSINPTNRFILSELSFLTKITEKIFKYDKYREKGKKTAQMGRGEDSGILSELLQDTIFIIAAAGVSKIAIHDITSVLLIGEMEKARCKVFRLDIVLFVLFASSPVRQMP